MNQSVGETERRGERQTAPRATLDIWLRDTRGRVQTGLQLRTAAEVSGASGVF